MGPLDLLWHLANFFAPAVGVGVITPSFAKLLWRRDLKSAPWLRLVGWTTAASAVVLIAGLVVFSQDGKIATYAAVVVAAGTALWWAGFRR
ncbi:hypothetical protein [Piscinibacter koreensis]|uniref:Uncharacterized protein n=1 Tax=Piscinibacter koreensis TaxID=2742824 RepID=A0A7Y6TW59_9BURK|nr:hypothetical protein [Schlegelella koreensis]NUZ05687.1 hypothetical protein [Schlegelella koreensis]